MKKCLTVEEAQIHKITIGYSGLLRLPSKCMEAMGWNLNTNLYCIVSKDDHALLISAIPQWKRTGIHSMGLSDTFRIPYPCSSSIGLIRGKSCSVSVVRVGRHPCLKVTRYARPCYQQGTVKTCVEAVRGVVDWDALPLETCWKHGGSPSVDTKYDIVSVALEKLLTLDMENIKNLYDLDCFMCLPEKDLAAAWIEAQEAIQNAACSLTMSTEALRRYTLLELAFNSYVLPRHTNNQWKQSSPRNGPITYCKSNLVYELEYTIRPARNSSKAMVELRLTTNSTLTTSLFRQGRETIPSFDNAVIVFEHQQFRDEQAAKDSLQMLQQKYEPYFQEVCPPIPEYLLDYFLHFGILPAPYRVGEVEP